MRRIVLAIGIGVLCAAMMPVRAVTGPDTQLGATPEAMTDGTIDVRFAKRIAPRAEALRAAGTLRREVPTLNITWNERFGTAKHVFADEGWLTAPAPRAPGTAGAVRIARAWIERHQDLFGLSAETVRALRTTRTGALPEGGPHALVFRTWYGDIPTFSGGTIGVNVARDGTVLTAWADTAPGATLNRTAPSISAERALSIVAGHEDVDGFVPVVRGVDRSRADRLTIFEDGGLENRHNARLVAFPTARGPRLAWRVFFAKAEEEMLSTAVDAETGEYVFRHNQVDHAEGRVYQNYPGAPRGGEAETISFDGDPIASPLTWVGLPLNADTALPGITTVGNNVFAWTDWAEYKLAPPSVPALLGLQANGSPEYAPVSPTGSFVYDFANNWGQSCTPTSTPAGVEAPDPVGFIAAPAGRTVENPSYIQDRDASVTNIFYLINKIHDLSYKYGFNEAFGNMQQENFGRDGKGFDAARYQAMAAVLRNALNNANMFTPVDGGEPADIVADSAANPTRPRVIDYVPPRGNMYLWRTIPGFEAPCADGDQDASIAWHEYTHGITNRMVAGPDDSDSLGAPQSGSMGEAWSDWVAMNFLFMLGLETRAAEGIYATGNAQTGIRNWALDKNPMTYGDFGYGPTGPQVHADGEIWSATLWDLRTAVIKALGKRAGEPMATYLVFDALGTSGRIPSYLDMRNEILASAKRRVPKLVPLVWGVFAKRGMGVSARTDGATDVTPTPGFDVPGAGNGILRGTVADADGGVLPNAGVVIGGFAEGQPNAAVRTNARGQFTAKLLPGSYKVTIIGPGYGLQPAGTVTAARGATVTRAFKVSKNLASVGYGGAVTAGLNEGDKGIALIDDRESSGQAVAVGRPVVMRLGGTGVASVRSVSVAHRPAGQSRLRTPIKYVIESSTNGRTWKRVRAGGSKGARVRPRPRVSDWTRLSFATPGLKARYIRITVIETLGGGSTAAFGDFQVFGSAPGTRPSSSGREAPFTEEGNVQLVNPSASSASLTLAAWQNTCEVPPAPVQGLDSYIVALPESAADGLHFFELNNHGGTATDLDAFFYAANCTTLLGGAATSAGSEAAALPAGTRWVQVLLYSGTTEGFDVRVTTTLTPVTPPRR